MTDPADSIITEDVLNVASIPTAVYLAVSLLGAQVEAIGDVDADDLALLDRWGSIGKENALSDILDEAERVRDWAQRLIDLVKAAEDPA